MTFIRITIEAPDKLFDLAAFERSLMQGQDALTERTADDFALSASTFENEDKPKITVEKTRKEGDAYKSAVVVTGDAYYYMNFGAPAHTVTPKGSGFLQFRHGSGFIPKTNVGTIMPSAGANTGQWVRKASVNHPGSQGRRIDLAIAAKHKDDLGPIGKTAIEDGLRVGRQARALRMTHF